VSQGNEAQGPAAKESGGFFRGLFGRGEHEIPGHDSRTRSGPGNPLELGDIQGFILRGYRMPMVRHFLLEVGVPAEARKLLGRFVSGNESDAPQSPLRTIGAWGSSQDQATIPLTLRAANQTIA